jgi:hypothetical protein
MDNSIIIILGIILLVLIILNHISIVNVNVDKDNKPKCSQTLFGCCPDGINSKINNLGTNCPGYRPGPGYPVFVPEQGHPVGGCAGTRYGCCPNNYTPKYDEKGSNCLLR